MSMWHTNNLFEVLVESSEICRKWFKMIILSVFIPPSKLLKVHVPLLDVVFIINIPSILLKNKQNVNILLDFLSLK